MNVQMLKKVRKEKKINLEEMSKITRLSRQAISNIEKGEDCKLSSVVLICNALDLKIIVFRNDQL